jgi:hypothetical protein
MIDFLLGFFWSGEKKTDVSAVSRYVLAAIILGALAALYVLRR